MNAHDDTRDDVRRTLEERARRLAQPVDDAPPVDAVELLHFALSQDRYALETLFVQRIMRVQRASRIPGLPAHFAGVMNFHGEIVTLIDLCALIGAPSSAPVESSRTIVLGRKRAELAIVVDDIGQIETVSIDRITASAAEQNDQTFVRRVLLDGTAVLDGAALLDDPRLFVSESTTRTQTPEGTE